VTARAADEASFSSGDDTLVLAASSSPIESELLAA